MNRIIFTLFLQFILIINLSAQENKMDKVKNLITEIKNNFAPDKRTVLFEINTIWENNKLILSGETNLIGAKDKLIESLNNEEIEFIYEIALLPSEKLDNKIYGVVNLSVANIRSKYFHSAELATQALLGSPVKVYKKEEGFYLIQTPDNYLAWVDNNGIQLMNKEEFEIWNESEKIIFESEYGFSYSNADKNSSRVSDLVAGNILIKLDEVENFYKVRYPDGRIAYTLKEESMLLKNWLHAAIPDEHSIIKTAERFIGIPYLWGGTSAKGMDCSGFTKTVYFLNGIVLQRDASQQVNTGILIETKNGLDNLRPGDLLFFGDHQTDSTKERITHVGIYKGNLEYIHSSGKVVINSFDKNADNFSEFRLNQFIRAKRIINSVDENGISSIKNNKFYLGDF